MNFHRLTLPALAACALAGAAQAQFTIRWSTVDGGSARSTGGSFALHGTVGQPDAAPALTGGAFKIAPGFWCGVTTVQMPDAPLLKIAWTPGPRATLSWPLAAAGFVLEESSTVGDPNSWTATSQPVVDTGAEHTVTVPAVGMKCYRLRRP